MSRDGPGLLLRDIQKAEDPQILAALLVIETVSPDILVLTDIDYDHGHAALNALPLDYPYRLALRPNSGLATGLDLDANGRIGEPRDAMGYGRFAGDGGLAILSRLPIDPATVTDLSHIRWADLPDADLPPMADEVRAVQRLSSTAHWIVPIQGGPTILAYAATPPVFDGPEDRNGKRARDETRLWSLVLDGHFGEPPDSFVIAGLANIDPFDGEGDGGFMRDFLNDPRWIDPLPRSEGGNIPDPSQIGDPALDTADWDEAGAGNLRVSYVLPSSDLTVTASGVFWPNAEWLGDSGPHRLVWVDIETGQGPGD